MPTEPEGSELVTTDREPGAYAVIVSDPLRAVAPTLSVTLTVKIELPGAPGMPAITPVPGVKVAQEGRLPEASAQM